MWDHESLWFRLRRRPAALYGSPRAIWEEIISLCPLRHVAYAFTVGAGVALFANVTLALGTAADAKAMLDKTVAALKADKAKTLDEINKGKNGFLVGDIYIRSASI